MAPTALHNVHKELAGVAHGHVEALAAGCQFWGYGTQVSDRRGPWGLYRWRDRGWGRGHHDHHHGIIREGHARGWSVGMESWVGSEIGSTPCGAPGRGRTPIASPTRFPAPAKAAPPAGGLRLTATAGLGLGGPLLRPPCAPSPPVASCRPAAPAPFTVLAAGTAPSVGVGRKLVVGWGLGAVGVWGWILIGEGGQQGPGGGPRQRSQGVLV